MQILWLLVFCCSLITVAPLHGASDKPKRGGTLTLGISREPVLMHPMVATGSVERKVRELMFESLLGVDINGKIQPSLAESWTITDNGRPPSHSFSHFSTEFSNARAHACAISSSFEEKWP